VSRSSPETCPNCGADIPANARACPECGADEQTGWSDEAYTNQVDLPDDSFDYDEFTRREFGGKRIVPYGVKRHWWVVALLMAILFGLGWLWFHGRTR
jgi:hypothetical protein